MNLTEYPHQKVRFIGMTQPDPEAFIEEFDPGKMTAPDAEDLISYCARVSNPANQANFDTAPKLLKYCIRKKHWSIFEMVNVVMEVRTTRDIGRQILRHQFKFQEFSQRYAAVDTDSFVLRECRFQDLKNRQSSLTLGDIAQDLSKHWEDHLSIAKSWEQRQKKIHEMIAENYEWAIQNNIAKEQARAILPEGGTMSCMYLNGTLRNWYHYTLLRMDEGTQREHQDIARKAFAILQNKFEFLREIEVKEQ